MVCAAHAAWGEAFQRQFQQLPPRMPTAADRCALMMLPNPLAHMSLRSTQSRPRTSSAFLCPCISSCSASVLSLHMWRCWKTVFEPVSGQPCSLWVIAGSGAYLIRKCILLMGLSIQVNSSMHIADM